MIKLILIITMIIIIFQNIDENDSPIMNQNNMFGYPRNRNNININENQINKNNFNNNYYNNQRPNYNKQKNNIFGDPSGQSSNINSQRNYNVNDIFGDENPNNSKPEGNKDNKNNKKNLMYKRIKNDNDFSNIFGTSS